MAHVFVTDEWFAELYERSYRRVVVTAYALTGDLGDAEEIAQDTYAIAYDRRRRVAAADNPEGWLHTVAVNLARRRHRRRTALHRLLRKEIPTPPVWICEHVELHTAIRRLTDDHRAVVVLHYLADMPVDEVASVLGIAVGTVKSRLSRARAALAEQLGADREVENA